MWGNLNWGGWDLCVLNTPRGWGSTFISIITIISAFRPSLRRPEGGTIAHRKRLSPKIMRRLQPSLEHPAKPFGRPSMTAPARQVDSQRSETAGIHAVEPQAVVIVHIDIRIAVGVAKVPRSIV